MVNKTIIFLTISYLLFGCKEPSNQIQKNQLSEEIKVSEENKNNKEKEAYDKDYLENLENLEISEKDFLIITKYIVQNAKKNIFLDIDPFLGHKEYMVTKDFTDPYSFYHYSNIPSDNGIEVVLKYKKEKNELKFITIRSNGSPGGFRFKDYTLHVLEKLNMKVIRKELLDYSNQLVVYHLTDGNFKYEIVGKNNEIEGSLPKEFYSFRIYL